MKYDSLFIFIFCQGRFEIISLVGSLIHKEESHCKVFGGLNVSLSSNGGVFGGQLIDILMAASPVQVHF